MIAVLDAPSNLGLRPPREGHEPGVRRLARALRGHGIADYTERLAARVGEPLDRGDFPVVLGGDSAAEGARAHLEGAPIEGFWIPLDADILDKSVMPAVDSPNPDGLSFEELTSVLRTLVASPRALGMHIAIYDPELDPDGVAGAGLTEIIVAAFP